MAVHRVYFSFDYKRDLHRVGRVHKLPNIVSRAAGGFESSTVWQRARRRGRAELHGLIDDALTKTSVTVVCVGYMTTYRTYLDYEVERSIAQGNGLVGLRINHLPDQDNLTDEDGTPPPLLEACGYRVHRYHDAARLVAPIEEAHELAQLSEAERLARRGQSDGALPREERRSEPRVELPEGTVWIDGEAYAVKNWNSRGFAATSYPGPRPDPRKEGDKIEISFAVPDHDPAIAFECEAKVFVVDAEKQEIVCVFVALDSVAKSALACCLRPPPA